MKYSYNKNNKGQVLVMLVVFVSIMTAVTTMAVLLMIANSSSASKFELGMTTLEAAESGAEVALLKLLRDPVNYTGEIFTLDGISVTVNVSGETTKTVVSTAVLGDFTKKVQLVINDPANDVMTITSWKEIY